MFFALTDTQNLASFALLTPHRYPKSGSQLELAPSQIPKIWLNQIRLIPHRYPKSGDLEPSYPSQIPKIWLKVFC